MQVFGLFELLVNDSRLVLFILLFGHVVQKFFHVVQESFHPRLKVDAVLLTLDKESQTHGPCRGPGQGKDNVTELFLGSQDVESRLGNEGRQQG